MARQELKRITDIISGSTSYSFPKNNSENVMIFLENDQDDRGYSANSEIQADAYTILATLEEQGGLVGAEIGFEYAVKPNRQQPTEPYKNIQEILSVNGDRPSLVKGTRGAAPRAPPPKSRAPSPTQGPSDGLTFGERKQMQITKLAVGNTYSVWRVGMAEILAKVLTSDQDTLTVLLTKIVETYPTLTPDEHLELLNKYSSVILGIASDNMGAAGTSMAMAIEELQPQFINESGLDDHDAWVRAKPQPTFKPDDSDHTADDTDDWETK